MSTKLSPAEIGKFAAAYRATQMIEDGMKVGLGTGSTAAWMVRILAKRVQDEGMRITSVATSTRTAALARALGLEVVSLDEAGWLDLTIDGADEFDPALNLIKGGGAALLQEKIVAQASERMVVIADAAKDVAQLGAFPLPVEVIPFGAQSTKALIAKLLERMDVGGREISLRMAGAEALRTDENNLIFDLHLGRIGDAPLLWAELNKIPGVVENGLFINICHKVVLGYGDGLVTTHGAGDATRVSEQAPLELIASLPAMPEL